MITESTRLNELPIDDLRKLIVILEVTAEKSALPEYIELSERLGPVLKTAFLDVIMESKRLPI